MMLTSCLPALLLQLPRLALPSLPPASGVLSNPLDNLVLSNPFLSFLRLSAHQVCLGVCARFSPRAIRRLLPSHPSPSQEGGGCSAFTDRTRAPLLGGTGVGGTGVSGAWWALPQEKKDQEPPPVSFGSTELV